MMLFLGGEAVALSTSCDLTITANFESTATKDDGVWDDKELVNCTYSGNNDSLYAVKPNEGAATYKKLFDALINGTALEMVFGLAANVNDSGLKKTDASEEGEESWESPVDGCYKGQIKLTSIALTAPRDGAATYKVSFESCGPLQFIEAAEGAA